MIENPLAKTVICLIGNPGSGKSTIANTLLQRNPPFYKSGFSAGTGIKAPTFSPANPPPAKDANELVADTMGLADTRVRGDAIAQINSVFRLTGNFKLVAVVELVEGRVQGVDIATITTILDCINLGEGVPVPFSIIVNKLKVKDYAKFKHDEQGAYQKLFACLNSGKYTTNHILLLPVYPELEAEDNVFLSPRPEEPSLFEELSLFIDKAPVVAVTKDNVAEIDGSTIEDLTRKQDKIRNQLENDRKEIQKQLDGLKKKMNKTDEEEDFKPFDVSNVSKFVGEIATIVRSKAVPTALVPTAPSTDIASGTASHPSSPSLDVAVVQAVGGIVQEHIRNEHAVLIARENNAAHVLDAEARKIEAQAKRDEANSTVNQVFNGIQKILPF